MAGGGPSTHRRAIWWTLAAVLAAAAGTGSFVASMSAADTAHAARSEAASFRIIQLRAALRRAHVDEVDTMALDVFRLATAADVSAARAMRMATRAMAIDELTEISHGSGTNANEAAGLVAMLADDDVLDGPVEPLDVWDAGRAAMNVARPVAGELPTAVDQLYDLMRADSVGHQVLNDALDAAYVARQPDIPELMTYYFDQSEPYLEADGGYLGPDREHPLVDSWVWDQTTEEPHELFGRVEEVVRSSGLWEYDQWIVSWQDGDPGPAPLALEDLLPLATDTDTQTRSMIDRAVADARVDALDRASDASTRERWWLAATSAIALFLIGSAVAAFVTYVRRVRERHRLATLDPLTGVGTRHLLEDRTAVLLADDTYASHLVAVVDMDRFKLINDTWGHTIGDLVLQEVAKRLQQIVDDICLRRPGTVGTLVRLGGDEFLVSLHSRGHLDADDLRRRLEDARRASIAARDGERVDLSFSIGVTLLRGPSVLSEAMDAADLATYEDKAARGVSPVERSESWPAGTLRASDDPTPR